MGEVTAGLGDELLNGMGDDELKKILDGLTVDERDKLALVVRGQYAREHFTPAGFADFYWCIWKRELPEHGLYWVERIFEAYSNGRGLMLKAFRGSTKSTVLNTTFTLFVSGHRPWGSSLVMQANDTAANKSSALMASLIEYSDGWQACFPSVVPDKRRGWGAEGYHVFDRKYEGNYDGWVLKTTQDHLRDPSFIAIGINSSSVVGMHPSNVLLLDDIHDEENTRSDREVEAIKSNLTANVLPIMTRAEHQPFIGVAYTPWTTYDAYAMMEAWGIFDVVVTPAYVVDEEGEEFRGQRVKFTWNMMDGAKLDRFTSIGEKDFARMFLCDLTAMEGINLKMEWLHKFPVEKLDRSYPVYLGVDYASTSDAYKVKRERDHFSVAFNVSIPGIGGILKDGFDAELSQGEAEQKLQDLAGMFPTLQLIGVEAVGKGEEFYSLMLRTTRLPIRPCTAHVHKGKGFRFERQLAPMFQFSRLMISSMDTPYLLKFKDQWGKWDAAQERKLKSDCLDAEYWAAFVGQGNLMPLPQVGELQFVRGARQMNPWKEALSSK